ncbi:MAG TPA: hypothetical protein PLL77_06845 [Pyrinomonadaceae bacterium]|nr:hypothetical protein [Pyrinomonadaceae bacterium]
MFRPISEQSALAKLDELRSDFRSVIAEEYEHRAKDCAVCETPGACCLDEHFVNVHVSRLEAVAIGKAIADLPEQTKKAVRERTALTIEKYKLDEAVDTRTATYACPLFEKGTGCLVHNTAKPLPCIMHACYSSAADLPPDELLDRAELAVSNLNEQTYRRPTGHLPIPLAITELT